MLRGRLIAGSSGLRYVCWDYMTTVLAIMGRRSVPKGVIGTHGRITGWKEICEPVSELYRFIHAEKANYPIALLSRVLHVARSSYYAWREGEAVRRRRQTADDALAHEITVLHLASRRTYGVPRIHAELRRLGRRVNRKRMARVMRERDIRGVTRRKHRSLTRPDKQAKPAPDPPGSPDLRFENGPLAVVDVEDGKVLAYCTGGLVLDMPAKSLPSLVDWTLKEAKLGAPKLAGPGKDADPLLVLTEAALEPYGLPVTLTQEEKHAGRLPEGHKVIRQLTRADWKLTKRGFGPWARIYRPATGSERACVQLCIPSWHALDTRHWGEAGSSRRPNSPVSWACTRPGS
ncbi:hypothetical protein ACE1SV_00590 [Streptomyces sennicomposti]